MQRVLVLSSKKHPLMPCNPARARALLREKKASVFKRYPFTIIMHHRESGDTQKTELKYDPGSKTTGVALNIHGKNGIKTVWAANLSHRGHSISEAITSRADQRGGRRSRNLRYRQKRYSNRARPKGWLAPSIMSRVHNCDTWAYKLIKSAPITDIVVETVRFDMQLMANPDISGVEYQRGTLLGFELREYLLQRDKHSCVYCAGASGDEILNIDHKHPRAKRGGNSVSNLVVSCRTCNEEKGALLLTDWLLKIKKSKSKLNKARAIHVPKIIANKTNSLRDAAAVNATRYKIGEVLKEAGLPVTFWSGGRTKKNRTEQNYQKDHWIDAACAGSTGERVSIHPLIKPLLIKATGHGSRQMCRVNKYGFPRTKAKQNSEAEQRHQRL
ncbi:MAG: hypothetical protein ACI808_000524 [Paraglaciecola sp.]|jgi:hypothetical protein